MASNNITQGLLAKGHQVKVMALATPKHPAAKALSNPQYVDQTGFESVYQDTTVNIAGAVRHIFSSRSYNIERFFSRRFEAALVSTLKQSQFDVIHFESAYTAPYRHAIRAMTNAPLVYRSHNMEYEIWQGTMALENNPLKKAYLWHLARQLKHFERRIANEFDGVATITKEDAATLRQIGCNVPIATIPFGLDVEDIASKQAPQEKTVFHLGSMDWIPNQDAVRWFLKEVWPIVLEHVPECRLLLAGRSMPDWLKSVRSQNVVVVGEIDNAYDFMAANLVMIVPLHSGGGMRIKIVEGLALSKPIVSTTIGAAGIDYLEGRDLYIADNSIEFAQKLIRLLENGQLRERMARAGRRLAEERYDNNRLIADLIEFYRNLMEAKLSLSS
ncbi:glycosyltransferase family 4 protein [Lentisalinibacter sediminis]|uniref:glycosyltransferase family 4 protein n=1 Tax=Lentisalinibacter sediminis TaxID=2992237 RepID=UPI00386C7DB1